MNLSLGMNSWRLVSFLAIAIGIYPLVFFLPGQVPPFLQSKSDEVWDIAWQVGFYLHITGGGIALLSGWSQFWGKIRSKKLKIHRRLGAIYWVAILFAGAPGGIFISLNAIGGVPSTMGFGLLGVFWFASTLRALMLIKNGRVQEHRRWMVRSFALTFAAVTLRLYLPLFTGVFGLEFEQAYIAISWLCWVPNLLIGELIIYNQAKKIRHGLL